MSHSFGRLLKQYLSHKPGLTQAKLSARMGYDPAIIARMVQGRRDLTGPSGRERVVRIIEVLHDEGVLNTREEANALLTTAGMPPLFEGRLDEAKLLDRLPFTSQSESQGPSSRSPTTPSRPSLLSGNLPAKISSFIGRERALDELALLLMQTRLLTLTGPGGSGKTRLAIELAKKVTETFEDGVRWVELDTVNDEDAIWETVGTAAGILVDESTYPKRDLAERWHAAHLLLILDNCEHVLDDTARLADQLLKACPHLKLLLTSREMLGVFGETVWDVPPLTIPAKVNLPPEQLMATSESVRLFCERAAAVNQTFRLAAHNAPYVAQICIYLDGIPLAIELAAARIRALSAKQITATLDQHLQVLTQGSRTAVPRQQTLLATVDWSYQRLGEVEQRVFRHLGVFSGGVELDALVELERASGTPLSNVQLATIMHSLTSKSLVKIDTLPDVTRYSLLTMIREYAQVLQNKHDEHNLMQRCHAQTCVLLAKGFEPHWQIEPNAPLLVYADSQTGHMGLRMMREQENVRSALAWSLSPGGEFSLGLQLASHMWTYWWITGAKDGVRWLKVLSENAVFAETEPSVRGRALMGLGNSECVNRNEARRVRNLGKMVGLQETPPRWVWVD